MEPRFGQDFSRVRIHEEAKAVESARAVNALAYTMGHNMIFGEGQYVPGTADGERLLAHELTHVVHQGRGAPLSLQRQAAEEEANDVFAEGPEEMAGGKKKKKKKATSSLLTFAQVQSHITSNNNAPVSTELLLCLIWKESGFDPKLKNPSSSATGLMQVTRPAVDDVNRNTPKGVHFKHSEMTDPAKNIACGTRYLKLRIDREGGDVKKGMEGFGTGSGYADNILTCETCLQGKPSDPNTCLHAIHP